MSDPAKDLSQAESLALAAMEHLFEGRRRGGIAEKDLMQLSIVESLASIALTLAKR